MRDADRIREQSPQSQTWGTVVMTLAAVVGICGVFAMGYTIGRRVERLAPCEGPPALVTRQVTDRLDLERQTHNELTFYDALMSDQAQEPATPAPPKTTGAKAPSAAHGSNKQPGSPKPAPPKLAASSAATKSAQSPAAASASAAKPADTAKGGTYTLQVSSVRHRDEAQALASAMTRQGLQAYITAATIPAKGTWYRVRVGHYESVQAANVAKANLAQSDIPAWVLRID